jgi:hypothetical protein
VTFVLPSPEQVDRRLRQMLAADSEQTGRDRARLMLMLTRSCELRCSYCFVALREDGYHSENTGVAGAGIPHGDMSPDTARRAVDWLLSSGKPRLSLQLFGGEPTRRWDTVLAVVERATEAVDILLTTNGLNLDRLSELRGAPLTIQLSVDGWDASNRFRRPFLLSPEDARQRWASAAATLNASGLRWFLNVTLPPAAAGEVLARYREAVAAGVPALQINYATGMRWTPEQVDAYLRGLWDVFEEDRREHRLQLYNRHHAADPAPLCGDVIADVDGTLLQVGGIFHEKRFPALRAAYRHGHLDDGAGWTERRATLSELWRRTRDALSPEEAAIFLDGMRIGAAADIVGRLASASTRPSAR